MVLIEIPLLVEMYHKYMTLHPTLYLHNFSRVFVIHLQFLGFIRLLGYKYLYHARPYYESTIKTMHTKPHSAGYLVII